MENKSPKYSVLDLESLREELINKTLSAASNISKIHLYFEFFNKVLSNNRPNLNEVFLREFIDDYVSSINKFDVRGIEPNITLKLIAELKEITNLPFVVDNIANIKIEIERIEKQLEKLELVLNGKDSDNDKDENHKSFFPLIDVKLPEGFYGILESVTVHINKTADSDKFIIVPSEKEIEKRISGQCRISWQVAMGLSKAYIKKPYKHHEIIISFDKREGIYEGDSLGIALTLSFLEQLLMFYNPTYIIKIRENTAFTGGIANPGKVLPIGEEIIKQKVSAVFFSEITTFVIPKEDETFALYQLSKLYNIKKLPPKASLWDKPDELSKLKTPYPKRNLKLLPVEDINDVLNRRDVVDIRKQKMIVRSGKFVKKNWVSAVVTVLLAVLFSFLFVMDFDDNPCLISAENGIINIKNKSGRILWNKKTAFDAEAINDHFDLQKYLVKIVDKDEDGKNEVLITSGFVNESFNEIKENTLTCFDHNGNKIWDYRIEDTVYSFRKGDEILLPPYSIQIIDTVTIDHNKQLYLYGSNKDSFSSLIFRIDLQSGKRIPGAFWCSGHILGAFIKDINNDGIKDIVVKGADNGYSQIVLFGKSLENLTGFRKTTSEYSFRFMEETELLFYIRLPKTDFDQLNIKERIASRNIGGFWYDYTQQKIIYRSSFSIENPKLTATAIEYQIHNNFKDIDLIIFDEFTTVRDTLVKHRKLNFPYTDTQEYKNIIKSQILYYKNGKWMKMEELD